MPSSRRPPPTRAARPAARSEPAGRRPWPAPPPKRRARARRSRGPAAPADEPLPPAWGWKLPDAGRAAHVTAAPEYQATTTQLCGLFPFVAGGGTPVAGTPVGRHQL